MDGELNNKIFIRSGACISALGNSIDEAWVKLLSNTSGLQLHQGKWEGRIKDLQENRFNTLLNKLLLHIKSEETAFLKDKDNQLIISTTKANIEDLPNNAFEQIGNEIKAILGLNKEPIIVSNACISGVVAINLAADLIKMNACKQAIVIGIDVLSEFVSTGFKALFALSDNLCMPYDKNRKGINLGEAGAYVFLSNIKENNTFSALFLAGASSNDANHISGPSRTGEGLYRAINKTLNRAGLKPQNVDYIQAHGTATLYNDEMESIAFNRLDLFDTPSNSFKAYIGHTLGAAGIVETIFALKSLEENTLIQSLGYQEHGLTKPMQIITQNKNCELNTILKSASGFGGGNAALLITKDLT